MSRFKDIVTILTFLSLCNAFTLPFNQRRLHPSPHRYGDLSVLQQQRVDNTHADLESMTVVQLKDELKKYELKVSGKKSDLIQRLSDYFMEQGQEAEEEEQESEHHTQEVPSASTMTKSSTKDNDAIPKIQIVKDETKSFSELDLIPSLQSSIELQGWDEPTPIQKLAIPTILNHFSDESETESSCVSIWAEAPTGSGKVRQHVNYTYFIYSTL